MTIPPAYSAFLLPILLAACLGAFVGIRREMEQNLGKYNTFMGVRTMTMFCVLGAMSTFVPSMPWLPIVLFAVISVLVLITYVYEAFKQDLVGVTSQLSALLMFWIGVFVGIGESVLAILLTIFLGILNEFRDDVHKFIRTLTSDETRGALKLLILSGAILPFLPQAPIDPWGIFNPFKAWLLVIFISGIGFLGYFLTKYFSKKGGTLLAGFLGSIVSSTAVTASMADQSKRSNLTSLFTAGILIALATMQFRVLLEILLLGGEQFRTSFVVIPLGMGILSSILAWWVFFRGKKPKNLNVTEDRLKLSSPFELGPALKFGALYVLVLFVLNFAERWIGDQGVYVAAALSGIVDIDAIVLSSLESAQLGELSMRTSRGAIATALIVNTIVKTGYVALLGSRKLLKQVAIYTGIITAFGIGLILVF